MNECDDSLDPSLPVRQGDVIEWLGDPSDPWNQHAIVVTADCDIKHGKHAGQLSCVPVLRHEDYLAQFPLRAKLEDVRNRLLDRAAERIRALQAARRPEYPVPMSTEAVERWLQATSTADILSTFRVHDPSQVDPLHFLASRVLECSTAMLSGAFSARLDALARAQLALAGSGDFHERRKKTARELLERLKSLPGDAVFIHCLSATKADGYVAYLRSLLSVRQQDIALNVIDLQSATVAAKRVSHLTSPFVFHLTQQLGQVFAAIGLPAAYEGSRVAFIEERLTHLGEPT